MNPPPFFHTHTELSTLYIESTQCQIRTTQGQLIYLNTTIDSINNIYLYYHRDKTSPLIYIPGPIMDCDMFHEGTEITLLLPQHSNGKELNPLNTVEYAL